MADESTWSDPATLVAMAAALISLLSALASFIFARRSHSAQSGALELEVRNMIRTTRTRVADLTMQNYALIAKDEKYLAQGEQKARELITRVIQEAIEENINSYDEACSKYVDGKIDRTRFRKQYQTEIRQIVEKGEYSKYFGRNTKYPTLMKVYEEWEQKPRV